MLIDDRERIQAVIYKNFIKTLPTLLNNVNIFFRFAENRYLSIEEIL